MSSAVAAALGTFTVSSTAGEAAAFCAATGLDCVGDVLPLTFPMRWLVGADVRAALLDAVADPDVVLVHESQIFDYSHRLRSGDSYALSLSTRRESAPERLLVDGVIRDASGLELARLETILRLIKAPA
ncbi:MAG: hypothetical protein P4L76_09305 [Beijerinckiaceae bacterium]|nr:hypothetical protein [Beijerinckiaceae bacterium]